MDDARTRIPGGSVYAEGQEIRAIGREIPQSSADEVIDARGCIVYPGLINCHHHLAQSLTRNVPQAQNCALTDWLLTMYGVWAGVWPEYVQLAARVGLGELLKSGCTTCADHFYLFPRDGVPDLLDHEIHAAAEMGIRFHALRGCMSKGRSQGGLPPDDVVQSPEVILADSRRVIETYHDPERFSTCRIGLGPTAVRSVDAAMWRELAALGRSYHVQLHTHLGETPDEIPFTEQYYRMRPLAFLESCGWAGPDVWFAHGIWFTDDEITRLGGTSTGIAHCPVSNCKLSSGVARVPDLVAKGARVGLGVDGSASNDCSDLLFEARVCHLIHKLRHGPTALPAEEVLWLATRGGARVLGRDDIGSLEVGKAADLWLMRTDRIDLAGGLFDEAALPILCGSGQVVDTVVVGGRIRVRHGRLVDVDEEALARRAAQASRELLERAGTPA
jgi:cytosine/adenosine deaminase-related metal-dependent hydrolase